MAGTPLKFSLPGNPLADIAKMIRFYSRLPVPALAGESEPHAPPDFARAAWALPLAGIVIALPAALVVIVAAGLRLPGMVAGILAITALVATTGAFHEDGLADTADGFGGGRSIERKLEIMKDSRIGTFGGAALVLSLMLRAALVAGIFERSGGFGAGAALLAAAAVSRTVGLTPLTFLPPAGAAGLSAAAVPPSQTSFMAALAIAGIFAGILGGFGGVPAIGSIGGAFAALAAGGAVTALAGRQIKGQTGDVAGAAQQGAEASFLLAVLIALQNFLRQG